MHAINLLMEFYNAKTKAAEQVLLYGYDHDAARLRQAESLLAASVDKFRELPAIAGPAYRTATSMETTQRQIPFRGGMNQFPNWQQCLPMYEKELATFQKRIAQLSSGAKIDENRPVSAAAADCIHAQARRGRGIHRRKGRESIRGRRCTRSASLAPELAGMKGIRIAPSEGGTLHFDLAATGRRFWLVLRATHRRGTRYSIPKPSSGTWCSSTRLRRRRFPPWRCGPSRLPAGANDLDLGKGQYVILGFIPADRPCAPHVNFAQTGNGAGPPNLDWLFE